MTETCHPSHPSGTPKPTIRRVGIVLKHSSFDRAGIVSDIVSFLASRGVEAIAEKSLADHLGLAGGLTKSTITRVVDLLVVLGGDGTILSVARQLHDERLPILAVNLGTLGFLAEINLDELRQTLDRILAGDYELSTRMRLIVHVHRSGERMSEHLILNDVVINKGALARIVELTVSIGGSEMAAFRADGLIVSTPTGSTAYNLSAGGPIIHPHLTDIVITPICPHTLTNRPIVIGADNVVTVKVVSAESDLFLTLDGQVGIGLKNDDIVEVKRADADIAMIKPPGRTYFDVLRTKLKWNER